jgi:hypothetical protein
MLLITDEAARTDRPLHQRLSTIGDLLSGAERLSVPLELPPGTETVLSGLIGAWASTRLSSRKPGIFQVGEDRQEHVSLVGIRAILPKITISSELAQQIWDKATDLDRHRDRQVRAFELYPVLARLFPDNTQVLVDRLRHALLSDQEDEARIATRGLYEWTCDAMQSSVQPTKSSEDLVREIGFAIAARRVAILRNALEFARWLFAKGPEPLKRLIAPDCEHGLVSLLEEANYERAAPSFDVPSIRAACVKLAYAMARAGFGARPGVGGWLTVALSDPLPEVRNAAIREPR